MRTRIARTILPLVLVACIQPLVSAQTIRAPQHKHRARHNRIVGVWDVQNRVLDCSTGAQIATFPALHKYELGGTLQVVPGGNNPTSASAHTGIWQPVGKNQYQMAFEFFRYDSAGNNIGWAVVRNDVAINEAATAYAGSGKAEIFDSNGNSLATSCPTFTGTRFQ